MAPIPVDVRSGQRIDSRTGRRNSRPRRSVPGSPGPHKGNRRDAKPLSHAFVIAAAGVRHERDQALGSMRATCPNVWRSPGRRGSLQSIAAAAALKAAGPTVLASRPRRVAAHGQCFAMGFGTTARPGRCAAPCRASSAEGRGKAGRAAAASSPACQPVRAAGALHEDRPFPERSRKGARIHTRRRQAASIPASPSSRCDSEQPPGVSVRDLLLGCWR